MTKNKMTLILTLSLVAGLILAGCGTQSTPEPVVTEAPQSADPQPVSSPQVAPTETAELAPTEGPTEAPR